MTGCPDGGDPLGALVLGRDGNFYGTTNGGGGIGPYGTVFKITADGKLTTLHSFGGPIDGSNPYGALVQSIDGNFYGTTSRGGPNANGTVFKITPNGVLTTLYSFCAQGQCADGATPFAGLVQASDGNFYGTSYGGGNHSCLGGCGTVFRISPVGTLTTLYSFNSDSGSGPYGGLMQAIDGYIYGTTGSGPSNFSGTVFRFTLGGKFATVHRFNQTDGAGPMAGLIQGSDGSLYGTTALGGAGNGVGSVFMIASGGKLTTLHSFRWHRRF
jgi:uncharacterized repeat protein (TIGR03803 family)